MEIIKVRNRINNRVSYLKKARGVIMTHLVFCISNITCTGISLDKTTVILDNIGLIMQLKANVFKVKMETRLFYM